MPNEDFSTLPTSTFAKLLILLKAFLENVLAIRKKTDEPLGNHVCRARAGAGANPAAGSAGVLLTIPPGAGRKMFLNDSIVAKSASRSSKVKQK